MAKEIILLLLSAIFLNFSGILASPKMKILDLEKSTSLSEWLSLNEKSGGEGGIRTHGTVIPHTRFPSVLLKPLGHLSLMASSLLWSFTK
jgi:hypothetical protein